LAKLQQIKPGAIFATQCMWTNCQTRRGDDRRVIMQFVAVYACQ